LFRSNRLKIDRITLIDSKNMVLAGPFPSFCLSFVLRGGLQGPMSPDGPLQGALKYKRFTLKNAHEVAHFKIIHAKQNAGFLVLGTWYLVLSARCVCWWGSWALLTSEVTSTCATFWDFGYSNNPITKDSGPYWPHGP